MAIIPKKYMKAVVAIGVPKENTTRWIGTGFVVGRPVSETEVLLYLVTNGHIFDGERNLVVRFNNEVTNEAQDVPMALYNNNGEALFTYHDGYSLPESKRIDIAVIQLNVGFMLDNHLEIGYFHLKDDVLTLDQMRETGVNEGTIVYSLGFPMSLVNIHDKTPICRIGCVARATKSQVADNNSILLDLQNFPGGSGSPIINRPEVVSLTGTKSNKTTCLIGIVHRYLHITGEKENTGIALANPVDNIIETIEKDYNRKQVEITNAAS